MAKVIRGSIERCSFAVSEIVFLRDASTLRRGSKVTYKVSCFRCQFNRSVDVTHPRPSEIPSRYHVSCNLRHLIGEDYSQRINCTKRTERLAYAEKKVYCIIMCSSKFHFHHVSMRKKDRAQEKRFSAHILCFPVTWFLFNNFSTHIERKLHKIIVYMVFRKAIAGRRRRAE